MKLVNLTPDTLNIHSNGQVLEVAPSGIVARVKDRVKLKNIIVGDFTIAVTSTKYSDVIDLPDPVKGTIYVVSALVLQRTANDMVSDWNEREDLFSPGELARNAEGVVVGCHGLSR